MTGGVTKVEAQATTLSLWERIVTFLEMIKVTHTVFALPFAVGAAFVAAGGMPELALLGKIVLAVLCARTAAMTFNRIADVRIDAKNPRTRNRALASGALSIRFALLALVVSSAAFVATAAWINPLALRLSPIALAVVLAYSLTKRVTSWCHVFLGIGLAIAPIGAWIAIRGELAGAPWFLGAAVLLWTAGFDILYACLDADFDRTQGLHSVPARLGVRAALRVAAGLHLAMLVSLCVFAWRMEFGVGFLVALGVVLLLLIYEHAIVRPDDLARVNRAFFATNGIISFVLLTGMIVEAVL